MRFVIPLIVVMSVGCGTSAPPEEATEIVEAAEFDDVAEFTEAGHTTDSFSTVKERLAKNEAVLIDVREQSEWDAGHLDVATLIPLSVLSDAGLTDDLKQTLPAQKPIYLHCRSGGRVLKVAEILRAEDLDVRPLKAGYDELVEQGFE